MTEKTFLEEGDSIEVKGSGKKPYIVKKTGGVVDCDCPAWRNVGGPIDVRVCKHIRKNVDRSCLLPQAHAMYDNKATKATKSGKKGSTGRKAAVKKDTAPPVLLAHKWGDEDPTGWWISEKLDGVRAWWDGEKFLSRLGNVYHAPDWFKKSLPKNTVLDGELFAGRGQFRKTISAVRKLVPTDSEWEKITYVVFDAPEVKKKVEGRISFLEKKFPRWESGTDNGRVCFLPQKKCPSIEYVKEALSLVEQDGGEGVMLREPGSDYEEGRSKTLLKVKSFFDAEADVVGYIPGKGRHKGRVGALKMNWDGVTFKVGTGLSDKQRKNPPSIGSKVTFRYQEISKKTGKPRFPSFIAARDYE